MILYITRKFPPSVGGMQRFNFKLVTNLSKLTEIYLIKWGGGQWFLPLFLKWAFARSLYAGLTRKISCIYVSDGLLSPLGLVLKWILRKPVIANIHGRDIAFNLSIYQAIVPWCLRRMDKVICVSTYLKGECRKRGVLEERLCVIPNGVDIEDFDILLSAGHRTKLEEMMGTSIGQRKIIVTVGRLVAKKGVDFFIKNILPRLQMLFPEFIYLIVGDGPLKEKIDALIKEKHLEKTVCRIGVVSMAGGMLAAIYKQAHVFAMPNVRVEGDMEGFGIVALEAGAAGLPVVAFKVNGIIDAVQDKESGSLIEENDYEAFAQTLAELLKNEDTREKTGEKAKKFVEANYSWQEIAKRYLKQFQSVFKPAS